MSSPLPVDNNSSDDEFLRPFEWLTDSASVVPIIESVISSSSGYWSKSPSSSLGSNDDTNNTTTNTSTIAAPSPPLRILHVGSGSSILGEYLVEKTSSSSSSLEEDQSHDDDDDDKDDHPIRMRIEKVVNVDKDVETLKKMEKRWRSKFHNKAVQSTATATAQEQEQEQQVKTKKIKDKMEYLPIDFAATTGTTTTTTSTCDGTDKPLSSSVPSSASKIIPYPDGHFHLAIDKSTLDCTLCSDDATAGLLTEVFRLLNPNGGTYIVISFHHIDLLKPLLEDIPCVDWEVSHTIMKRQVEDLIGNKSSSFSSTTKNQPNTKTTNLEEQSTTTTTNGASSSSSSSSPGGAWASGFFEPSSDEQYRKTVNVFICQRRHQKQQQKQSEGEGSCNNNNINNTNYLDRDVVKRHVNETNDAWFQLNNPMLTTRRKETIQNLFEQHKSKATTVSNDCNDNNQNQAAATAGGGDDDRDLLLYDLPLAYQILFTDEEREHLEYDFFLEDWQAWITAAKKERDPSLPQDKMSVETALAFLQEMQ